MMRFLDSQFVEECLGVFQSGGVEHIGEPAIQSAEGWVRRCTDRMRVFANLVTVGQYQGLHADMGPEQTVRQGRSTFYETGQGTLREESASATNGSLRSELDLWRHLRR